jgi:hypothetical protein
MYRDAAFSLLAYLLRAGYSIEMKLKVKHLVWTVIKSVIHRVFAQKKRQDWTHVFIQN